MQKVKMMLLSLALFAVVGGALAFKAKFTNTWCTTDAYFDSNLLVPYYCSFDTGSQVFTTTTCGSATVTSIQGDANGTKKVCTTLTLGGSTPCATTCGVITSTKADH